MKMLTNMAHLQYHLRKCYIKAILKNLVNQNEILIELLC